VKKVIGKESPQKNLSRKVIQQRYNEGKESIEIKKEGQPTEEFKAG
jgi:hypothetical protein